MLLWQPSLLDASTASMRTVQHRRTPRCPTEQCGQFFAAVQVRELFGSSEVCLRDILGFGLDATHPFGARAPSVTYWSKEHQCTYWGPKN